MIRQKLGVMLIFFHGQIPLREYHVYIYILAEVWKNKTYFKERGRFLYIIHDKNTKTRIYWEIYIQVLFFLYYLKIYF